jgi:LAO/AO transport system kinase
LPALKVAAIDGTGVAELSSAIDRLAEQARMRAIAERRRRRARYLVARAAASLIAAEIRGGGDQRVEALTGDVLAGRIGPDEAARRLLSRA